MKNQKWMVYAKKADFKAISDKYKIDIVTARLLRNRELIEDEDIRRYLNAQSEELYDETLMKDLVKGVEIILNNVKQGKKIRIIGDYDIDGVTSTYILCQAISLIGGEVDYIIPDRIMDGYGLNMNLIKNAVNEGIDTILTCDNGIAAEAEIEFAKSEGLTVVITDHHNVPFEEDEKGNRTYKIPKADAVINPKQEDCNYPFKELCGAAVSFKFASFLLKEACKTGTKIDDLDNRLKDFLMFASIGTVGDIMELRDENRIIVSKGLELIHETKNISIKALIEATKLTQDQINTYHIGFILGPCINASGRLKTAEYAVRLFMSQDEEECRELAELLVSFNEERKNLTEKFLNEAIDLVDNSDLNKDKVLVVHLKECHESLAGIIAGRLREKYNKPILVLTNAESSLKGSGRSIESYNMYDELVKVKDVFIKFGGHKMAAGFSLNEDRLDELRRRLNENCTLTEDDMQEVVHIDMAMPLDYITMPLIREFELLKPFGPGNESPLFAVKGIKIARAKLIGRDRKFLKFAFVTEQNTQFEGISFDSPEIFEEFLREKYSEEEVRACMSGKATNIKISICYVPEINDYNGYSIQIRVKGYKHYE